MTEISTDQKRKAIKAYYGNWIRGVHVDGMSESQVHAIFISIQYQIANPKFDDRPVNKMYRRHGQKIAKGQINMFDLLEGK